MNRALIAACFGLLALTANASTSRAGGFLADTFIRPFSPPAADAADRAHAKMGNPLDHAANGAAGAALGLATANPGAGAAVTSLLEARDAARRQQ